MDKLPLFYYPTTLAWLDDDELFLQAGKILCKNNCFETISFNSPEKGLAFFSCYEPLQSNNRFLKGDSDSENYDLSQHMPVDWDFKKIMAFINDQQKNKEISVLVVDYNMPQINGIEICRRIKNLPLRKILITGEGDEKLAIAAFNEGIIDCFIKKGSLRISQEVLFHLQNLSQRYLVNNTSKLRNHLETDYPLPHSDPEFAAFFSDYCAKNKIAEYYLIDKNGHMLLKNHVGEQFYFVTHTDRTLDAFIELYSDNDNMRKFIHATKTRQKIPFFGPGKNPWELASSQWQDYFFHSQVFMGREAYWWCVVEANLFEDYIAGIEY